MTDVESPDDLYGLDPAEFIAARDRLARAVRGEGRRDEAAQIARLRRPPQSAWALNLLARTDPAAVDAVLAAATGLRDALADEGADRRAAQAEYRDAIEAAVDAATSLGEITGEDMRSRIRTNLLAAGVDEAVAADLRNGTLRDDQEAPGFGAAPTIGPVVPRPSRAPTPKPSRTRAATGKAPARPSADERAAVQAEKEARAQAEADELERKRVARRRAELGRELQRLERRASRLREQADVAEDRATAARDAADQATAEATAVADQLDQLDRP